MKLLFLVLLLAFTQAAYAQQPDTGIIQDARIRPAVEKIEREMAEKMRGTADTYILRRLMKEELSRRFKNEPGSMALLSLVYDHKDKFTADELHALYRLMSDSLRGSSYAVGIKEKIDREGVALVGSVLPDFTQPGRQGQAVTVASLRGKYVLLDFWASWCLPCRNENPALAETYARFREKGFEILGISLDEQQSAWLEAIRKDSLPWLQVSDGKGWQNEAARLFKIKYIPDNILIDRQGRIVAKDIHGEALTQLLLDAL
jgi:peroxiredoxin